LSRFAISDALNPSCFSFRTGGHVYRGRTAFVVTRSLGLGDALELTLSTQVGLELREYAQHVEKRFPAAVLVSIGCSVAWSRAARYLVSVQIDRYRVGDSHRFFHMRRQLLRQWRMTFESRPRAISGGVHTAATMMGM
jgi:hypothetical protein